MQAFCIKYGRDVIFYFSKELQIFRRRLGNLKMHEVKLLNKIRSLFVE